MTAKECSIEARASHSHGLSDTAAQELRVSPRRPRQSRLAPRHPPRHQRQGGGGGGGGGGGEEGGEEGCCVSFSIFLSE